MFMLAKCPTFIRFYYKYLWRPKPDSLEAILNEFSNNAENIFFVQIGSNDGFQHDPLCKFIKRDGWRGLLLEPQPSAFESLQYIYQHDSVTPINRALDQEDKQRKLFKVAFSKARWATGLSSFNRTQLVAMLKSGHISRQCAKYGIRMPQDEAEIIGHDWIQCSSFDTLITENGVDRVDLIHIDTEGYDYEVLKMFPFCTFQPKIVIFEHSHLSQEDKKSARQMLEGKGYELKYYGADTLALKE